MPLTYPGPFALIGRIASVIDDLTALQSDYRGIGPNVAPILDAFENREDLVEGLVPQMDGFAAQTANTVGELRGVIDRVLADLQSDLNAPDASYSSVLQRLAEDMIEAGATIQASTVGAPTVAAVAGNLGTGTLVASKVDALGRDAEVGITETVRFVCTRDKNGGATAGGETFGVTGWPTASENGPAPYGNGDGSDVAVINNGGGNLLANGDFDDFTVPNTPDGWTVGAGVVGTNIYSEATTVHTAGGKALKLQGNSSAATITLTQNISASVATNTRYVVGAMVRKGAGTLAAGSNLDVKVTGTGFTTAHLFNADPATLSTTYALKSAFFNVGETIPADLTVTITWTTAGGVASTGQVFIDDAAFGLTDVFGGFHYKIFRGATDFALRDAFTSQTSVADAVFQGLFRRMYGVQLPSSGSPTIADPT